MALLQLMVLASRPDFEVVVVTEKFVACCNQHFVTVECNAAQAPVSTAALEVYLARVPVDRLQHFLLFKIDHEYAAVTLTFAAAAHDRGRD